MAIAKRKKWLPLAEQEIAGNGGFTHFSSIDAGDLKETATATAEDISAGIIPKNCYVQKLIIRKHKPFRDKSDRAFNSLTAAVGDSASPTTFLAAKQVSGNAGRAYNDGVTTDESTTLTSASATFVAGDVGKRIIGAGIPDGTTIASRTNGTTIELSQPATASASGVTITLLDRTSTPAATPNEEMNTATGPYAADDDVIVRFTPPAGKANNDIDEGELHVYAQFLDPYELSRDHGAQVIAK